MQLEIRYELVKSVMGYVHNFFSNLSVLNDFGCSSFRRIELKLSYFKSLVQNPEKSIAFTD